MARRGGPVPVKVFHVCERCKNKTMRPAANNSLARRTLTLVEEDIMVWADETEELLY